MASFGASHAVPRKKAAISWHRMSLIAARWLPPGRIDGFVLAFDASVGRGMEPDDLEAGLSYREYSTAMELVAASGGLKAIALTGFDTGARPRPLRAAYGYLSSALGKRILDRD